MLGICFYLLANALQDVLAQGVLVLFLDQYGPALLLYYFLFTAAHRIPFTIVAEDLQISLHLPLTHVFYTVRLDLYLFRFLHVSFFLSHRNPGV